MSSRATAGIREADLIPVSLPAGEDIGYILLDVFYYEYNIPITFSLEEALIYSLKEQGVKTLHYWELGNNLVCTIDIEEYIMKAKVRFMGKSKHLALGVEHWNREDREKKGK